MYNSSSNFLYRSRFARSLFSSKKHFSTSTPILQRNPLLRKILIANRVIRTAKKLGIKTVAVYSQADVNAMHVKMADEAYLLGPATSSESYLNQEKICQIAKKSNCNAIHPGYGFLSENADFCEKLQKLGISFIGPDPSAIRAMGSKSESKNIMIAANVPVVPGYHGDKQSPDELRAEAAKIGYPVLIKAIKGGGGKGMRIVEKEEDFDMMLSSARKEAVKSFSDDKVLIEKYIKHPRHVEVQVFADKFGDAVYLFERDCSVQRRHQKILEESPAPNLSLDIRTMLGETAVAAAKAVNYLGAGTVEFIMDNETNTFYFMEMNTRLQVEHPVTEMVTGTDLVEWQIEVASGNRLLKTQESLSANGHAFEARIYAESPENEFLPDIGNLVFMKIPAESQNIRVETGVKQGDDISVYYDPMIAKLVVHGPDRESALRILDSALHDLQISGVKTNIEFLKKIINSQDFILGNVETGFINKNRDILFETSIKNIDEYISQAAYTIIQYNMISQTKGKRSGSPWDNNDFFQVGNISNIYSTTLVLGDELYKVELDMASNKSSTADPYTKNQLEIKVYKQKDLMSTIKFNPLSFSIEKNQNSSSFKADLVCEINSCRYSSTLILKDKKISLFGKDEHISMQVQDDVENFMADGSLFGTANSGSIAAPMASRMSQLLVTAGEEVVVGTPLVVLEAMKMEHVIKSPKAGVIKTVNFAAGDLVSTGDLLVTFEEQ
ncbi:Methylcrotonoyl-CoA carboxylase subunit alpha, mitochondrial [Smittium culicis]|uniref:Methylcrotonoyl-CoA carboxylase subunit alpha, mitochondrial n=1 Tax=Smittium culicis TaxID=133412 RepID=A0A1R1X5F7_9FUNG|nr:Methylcrotonoyl-CoA carboxylase subunit alpha, mitochondrial [Smittium culicis]